MVEAQENPGCLAIVMFLLLCKSRSNTTSQKRLICSAAPD